MITGNRFYLDRIYELSHIASRLCALGYEPAALHVGAEINSLFLDAAASDENGLAYTDSCPNKNALQAVQELAGDLWDIRRENNAHYPDLKTKIRDLVSRLGEMVRILKEFEGKYDEFSENLSVNELQALVDKMPRFPGPGDDW